MKTKFIFIINHKSNESSKIAHFLRQNGFHFYSINPLEEMSSFLISKIKGGSFHFVICGGDGTINNFVNSIMKIPKVKRKKVRIGIIPCGRANDLARELELSKNPTRVLKTISKNKIKKIDLIKVNGRYFITGGGVGLPAEVVSTIGNEDNKMKRLFNLFKSKIYYLAVLKILFFGSKGVFFNSKEHMAICVMNQGFIGKKFKISPESKNNDGLFEICFIEKKRGFLANLKVIHKI